MLSSFFSTWPMLSSSASCRLRWMPTLAPGQELMFRADVGGFGAGSPNSHEMCLAPPTSPSLAPMASPTRACSGTGP
jgi:hypothetical protein